MSVMDQQQAWLDYTPSSRPGGLMLCKVCKRPIDTRREWKRRDAGVVLSNGYRTTHDVNLCSEDCDTLWLLEQLSA